MVTKADIKEILISCLTTLIQFKNFITLKKYTYKNGWCFVLFCFFCRKIKAKKQKRGWWRWRKLEKSTFKKNSTKSKKGRNKKGLNFALKKISKGASSEAKFVSHQFCKLPKLKREFCYVHRRCTSVIKESRKSPHLIFLCSFVKCCDI